MFDPIENLSGWKLTLFLVVAIGRLIAFCAAIVWCCMAAFGGRWSEATFAGLVSYVLVGRD